MPKHRPRELKTPQLEQHASVLVQASKRGSQAQPQALTREIARHQPSQIYFRCPRPPQRHGGVAPSLPGIRRVGRGPLSPSVHAFKAEVNKDHVSQLQIYTRTPPAHVADD